jgi:hypothetical protein
MEDQCKTVVDHQRRLTHAMREVVKKEVIKLLDAGIIYPVPQSEWVSPVRKRDGGGGEDLGGGCERYSRPSASRNICNHSLHRSSSANNGVGPACCPASTPRSWLHCCRDMARDMACLVFKNFGKFFWITKQGVLNID